MKDKIALSIFMRFFISLSPLCNRYCLRIFINTYLQFLFFAPFKFAHNIHRKSHAVTALAYFCQFPYIIIFIATHNVSLELIYNYLECFCSLNRYSIREIYFCQKKYVFKYVFHKRYSQSYCGTPTAGICRKTDSVNLAFLISPCCRYRTMALFNASRASENLLKKKYPIAIVTWACA